jgi:ParB family transcriptional regulator, chromosome partitioning protein
MSTPKRNALGKGLSALLKNDDLATTLTTPRSGGGGISHILISQIEANPFQPRLHFDQTQLEELAESIKVHGVIQPITVRKVNLNEDRYQIISGERRTKASVLAGLTSIPAYVRVANDQEMLEMALIENIQRQDLNSIEVALSYQRLMDECSLKIDEVGERVGKQRSTVNNYLRLLRLPDEIQAGIRDNKLSMGHARAIINIDDADEQMLVFNRIVEDGLSVRDTEELARQTKAAATPKSAEKQTVKKEAINGFDTYTGQLSQKLSVKVKLKSKGKGKGEIVIPFDNEEQLAKIFEIL